MGRVALVLDHKSGLVHELGVHDRVEQHLALLTLFLAFALLVRLEKLFNLHQSWEGIFLCLFACPLSLQLRAHLRARLLKRLGERVWLLDNLWQHSDSIPFLLKRRHWVFLCNDRWQFLTYCNWWLQTVDTEPCHFAGMQMLISRTENHRLRLLMRF